MRRGGFTLIEVMAVVALLGLLAGAVVWSMTDEAKRWSREDAVGRIAHADRRARIAARRLGRPCVLRFDLDRQVVCRVVFDDDGTEMPGHVLDLPVGHRIDRVVFARAASSALVPGGPAARGKESGVVDVACSTAGRSASYALRLVSGSGTAPRGAPAGRGDGRWLVFAGLTGQMVLDCEDDEVDNLFAVLETGRPDAH